MHCGVKVKFKQELIYLVMPGNARGNWKMFLGRGRSGLLVAAATGWTDGWILFSLSVKVLFARSHSHVIHYQFRM